MKYFARICCPTVNRGLAAGVLTLASCAYCLAQSGMVESPTAVAAAVEAAGATQTNRPANGGIGSPGPVIGPGDDLEVSVYGAADLSGRTRVSAEGKISLPLVGAVPITGLTSDEAAEAIAKRLRDSNLVKDPQVQVYVKEYTHGGISVSGEVNKPGVYSALGPHRLFDILQSAGGPTEKAGSQVTISHRVDPENAKTVVLSKDPLETARNNIELLPGDTVVVARAGIVYVLGEVNRPGGYAMNSGGAVSVLQAVAAAGGPTRVASLGAAKMLRKTPNGLKELPVPLKKILQAKSEDVPVQADDILFVPSSRVKSAMNAGALLTNMGTATIYRLPF